MDKKPLQLAFSLHQENKKIRQRASRNVYSTSTRTSTSTSTSTRNEILLESSRQVHRVFFYMSSFLHKVLRIDGLRTSQQLVKSSNPLNWHQSLCALLGQYTI